MLHTYPFGHSHAFRSEALKCKNEPYQGRTYGTTSVDYCFNSCYVKRSSRHVLSGGQNVHTCHTRRTTRSRVLSNVERWSRDHYSCAELTSNRHASVLPEDYAKSLTYSFGLREEDHGVAVGLSNDSIDAANIGSSSSSSPILSSFFSVA